LFELRQLDHCPPHFYAVDFDLSTSNKKITDWIWENLKGRFYFGDSYLYESGRQTMKKQVAFEVHSEASYFALVLNEINKF